MTQPILSTDPVERVEELAEKIGFKKQWDSSVFIGSAYEHVLPLFEATYEWITYAHFNSHAQQSRKRNIERAAVEIWPPYTGDNPYASQIDPTVARAEVFIAHILMVQTLSNYYEVAISEWPIDRLLMEFSNAYEMRNQCQKILNYLGVASFASASIEVGAKVVATRFAVTAVLKGTGIAGLVITFASAAITWNSLESQNRLIAEIDKEITLKRIPSEISEDDWDIYERDLEDKYGGEPEPEELR